MAKNKRPTKKYRPRARFVNPLGYVIENISAVSKHDSYLIDLKIKNSQAMAALLKGAAVKDDIDKLVSMSNIVEALCAIGFGKEYAAHAVDGREAVLRIVYRAVEIHRFVPTGPEINALNMMMELHDAQMDVITLGDMDRALTYATNKIRNKGATKLPRLTLTGA